MHDSSTSVDVLIRDKLLRLVCKGAPKPPGKRAIVFVHGFIGDALETWIAPGAPESFPAMLATDPDLADHDVFLFQYVTKNLHPPAIDNIVAQLKFALKEHLHYSGIVLISHSMGGLVAMRYILRLLEEGHLESICGLMLYGVPMTGVEWARYAQVALGIGQFKLPVLRLFGALLKTNKQVTALTTGSEFIDRLQGNWVLRVLNGGYPRIPAEQRAWVPVRVVSGNDDWVVPESSAKSFYSEIDWIDLDKNHREIVKPKDRSELGYQVARDFLRECRAWMNPPSLLKLRRQIDDIWKLHSMGHIADWHFELEFDWEECVPASGFGLTGFRRFTVHECSYRRRIDKIYLRFGFANGHIAAGAIWSDEFVFLHSLRFGALPQSEGQAIQKRIHDLLQQPEKAWTALFNRVRIAIRQPNTDSWFELGDGPLETVNDGLVRRFSLPPEAFGLIGEEAFVNVTFESIMPLAITDYAVEFPWLCDGFIVRATVEGGPAYLIANQAMRGNSQVQSSQEPQRRIEYSSEDLVLPGSRIQFEWALQKGGQP